MSSKVYDKPDRSVSLFWECDRQTPQTVCIVANPDGTVVAIYDTYVGTPHSPFEGRWRPYIPNNTEPWPPRKLMPRRCWATYNDTRRLFVWFPEWESQPFRSVGYIGIACDERDLTNINYIDPEQEAVEVEK